MYKGTLLNLMAIFTFCTLSSCSEKNESPSYTADFDWAIDSENPNQVNFTNKSEGEYLYFEWDYGNGEESGTQTDKTYQGTSFYPNKGQYSATIKVWGPTNTNEDTKTYTETITINEDDEDYISPEPEEGLIWSDEFNGTSVDLANWEFETGAGGWGNQELQNYTDGDNAHISNGRLIITAKKVDDNKTAGSYTSSRMVTKGLQEFTYGRMEIRAKLPEGTGMWPAIWMLGANISEVSWPACGEIDIMEYVGYQPNIVHSTVHTPSGYAGNGNGNKITLDTAEEEFHTYGVIWTEESLTFYVDTQDNVVHTYAPAVKNSNNWPFNKPHFFILNVAVGGSWGGVNGVDNSIFPQTMEVDYVRVYEL